MPTTRKTITDEQLTEVIRLSKHLGLSTIAKRLGLPDAAVRRAMIWHSWRTRNPRRLHRNQWSKDAKNTLQTNA